MMVPADIVTALVEVPAVGDWDPVYPLLTVDESGYPHVCLLSRAQLDADAVHIYAAIASTTTMRNIERTRQAGLIVMRLSGAIHIKLDAHHIESAGAWLLAVFAVSSATRDGMAVPLEPSRFCVTEALVSAEDWGRANQLLGQLRRRTVHDH